MTRANRPALVKVILWFLVIGLVAMGAAAGTASAQVLYGSIAGTLTDETGAVVPNAVVTAKNTSTGLTRQATTDGTGHYSIPNLVEGTYDLSVSAKRVRPLRQKGVTVPINIVTRIDMTLRVGAISEQVAVEASTAILQTAKADVNVNLTTQAIGNLPLSNYRNYQTLINLVPGATPARFQNAVTDTPGRALSTNVNGQERGANNTRLDGSADILVTMPHHAVYVPPVESIEEVNISTNNFDAEQGMTGGAAVTVVTKAGTNDFRGSVFALHDNSALRAFTWDENSRRRHEKAGRQPEHRRRQPRRTDQEEQAVLLHELGRHVRTREPILPLSVPTADFRTGDFSRMLGAPILDANGNPILVPTTEGGLRALREGMIFDPFSGNLDGTGGRSSPAAGSSTSSLRLA